MGDIAEETVFIMYDFPLPVEEASALKFCTNCGFEAPGGVKEAAECESHCEIMTPADSLSHHTTCLSMLLEMNQTACTYRHHHLLIADGGTISPERSTTEYILFLGSIN